ncbi:ABC transporter permease [Solibacillus sp. FSL K6-1126]|uniref:ABC transporter permease n=1 Tax=Solibacillus sp. FSL K6-1126 TaxID=2921463 RepID=UPI0030F58254
MLFDYILFEFFKLKRQKIWLLIILVPFISVLLGFGNFMGNYSVLMDQLGDNAWLEAWTQITLFYGIIFLPISSGLFAALICRTEHLNGGWKLQFSLPFPQKNIFFSKLFIVLTLILFMQVFLSIFYLIGGMILNIEDSIPWLFLLTAVFLSWVGTFTLSTIQLWLSFKIKSFGIPLAINIMFSLLVFGAYTSKLGMLYPWAQPSFAISSPDESPVDSMPIFIGAILLTFLLTLTVITLKFGKSDLEN